MNSQSQEIIKLDEVYSTTKSTQLGGYFFRKVENLKSNFNSTDIAKKTYIYLILLVTSAVVFLFFTISIFLHGFDKPAYQLNPAQSNVAITTNIHRQEVLSDYLKTMTAIILKENPQEIRKKAATFRAITQATLEEIDPIRKRFVIMFLEDTQLLKISTQKQVSLLMGVNLAGVNLQGINFRFNNLQGVNLEKADLRGADLRKAKLSNAKLTNSCYNNYTLFDKNFDPVAAGMKEVAQSQVCF
ncbi:pentapeptide repeat-containing protein [Rivularia sp. UHCC 0363]|uniref:pentapeptide repeat-containing protein n=1 Tax=Rivularia sp. UHCC 0363 TaxID=3110244 RepID=UPI002B1F768B|nr:pentapeptide repeat-containing protein [Rivularia sp. UHCC 0363]MEA5596163.1 pentapeptide repeat-containing protein [Rivularia sp. UHCC 0363]